MFQWFSAFPQYKAQYFQSQWGIKGSEGNESSKHETVKAPARFSFQTPPLCLLDSSRTVCSRDRDLCYLSSVTRVRLRCNFLGACRNTKHYKKNHRKPLPTSPLRSVASASPSTEIPNCITPRYSTSPTTGVWWSLKHKLNNIITDSVKALMQ